ncbi:hypothetical protein AB3S75_008825 [Citrus x aurantiifolia]
MQEGRNDVFFIASQSAAYHVGFSGGHRRKAYEIVNSQPAKRKETEPARERETDTADEKRERQWRDRKRDKGSTILHRKIGQ